VIFSYFYWGVLLEEERRQILGRIWLSNSGGAVTLIITLRDHVLKK
jgi:hypothetical protein